MANYAQGALTHAVARNGSTIVSETEYTGIDAQGRVTASIQKTPGLADSALAYQYSSTGQLAAVQYPSGRWISCDINGANRVKAGCWGSMAAATGLGCLRVFELIYPERFKILALDTKLSRLAAGANAHFLAYGEELEG